MPIFNQNGESIAPVSLDGSGAGAVSEKETTGENGQEVAEPASDPDEATETDGEIVAPEEGDAQAETGAEPKQTGSAADKPAKPQSRAENKRFAAERRKAETEAIVEKARDELLREIGLTDPVTGDPYESYAEYLEHTREKKRKIVEEQLRKAGIDPAVLNELIESNPAVTAAKEITERAAEAERKATEQAEKISLTNAIAEITALDPSIRTFEDLAKMERFPDFRKLVNAGFPSEKPMKCLQNRARRQKDRPCTTQSPAKRICAKRAVRPERAITGSRTRSLPPCGNYSRTSQERRQRPPTRNMEGVKKQWMYFRQVKFISNI